MDLTGRWQANDLGLYDIHQSGSCLYWLGMSTYLDTEPGTFWTNVMYGTIRPDFTITGHWGDVPFNPEAAMNNGEIALRIDFDSSGAEQRPVLRATDVTGGFGGSAWVPIDAIQPAVDVEGAFGGNFDHLLETGCLWIQSGNERYELIGDGGWSIRGDPPIRIEDERGQVFARDGDLIRVRGRVAAGLSSCVESAILVDALEPMPSEESPP